MRFVDIIEKKRYGEELSQAEIEFWITGLVKQSIPDYQSSALLMAIVLQGMNQAETAALTKAMAYSGKIIDLSPIKGLKVDKHSTGGVGDKTTLVLAPLVAACGAKVAKMSGRGLGHTGGTIDKLESITGFQTSITLPNFIKQVNELNIALIGQSADTAYADKVLYALRDVTATVASIPLIASSIMSKKIASGADAILLDVKYGDGAFMATKTEAVKLAKTMIEIGQALGKDVRAMITSMEQPLGYAIGNALEVKEAINTLKGEGPADLTELCLTSGALMLIQDKIAPDFDQAYKLVEAALTSGQAYEKFIALVAAQGGLEAEIRQPELLPAAKQQTIFKSPTSGYITQIKAAKLGHFAMLLGAGRAEANDKIDFGVGLLVNKKVGDYVKADESLGIIHHNAPISAELLAELLSAYSFSAVAPVVPALIEQIL